MPLITTLIFGENYFFESVTGNYWIGTLVSIDGPHTVVLSDAAWVSETGRLHVFMRDGKAENMEVEPVGVKAVHWASWSPWPHPLFTKAIPT